MAQETVPQIVAQLSTGDVLFHIGLGIVAGFYVLDRAYSFATERGFIRRSRKGGDEKRYGSVGTQSTEWWEVTIGAVLDKQTQALLTGIRIDMEALRTGIRHDIAEKMRLMSTWNETTSDKTTVLLTDIHMALIRLVTLVEMGGGGMK